MKQLFPRISGINISKISPKKVTACCHHFGSSGHHGTHLRCRFHGIRRATFADPPPWWVAQGAPGTWGAPCWCGSNLVSRPWNRLSSTKAARFFSPSKMCLEGCIEVNKAERKDGDGRWAGGRIWNLDVFDSLQLCCLNVPLLLLRWWKFVLYFYKVNIYSLLRSVSKGGFPTCLSGRGVRASWWVGARRWWQRKGWKFQSDKA